MINTKDLVSGQKFKHEGKSWICTANNGFMLSADNLDPNDVNTNITLVGLSYDVELIN